MATSKIRTLLARVLKRQSTCHKLLSREDVTDRRKSAARRNMKYRDSVVAELMAGQV